MHKIILLVLLSLCSVTANATGWYMLTSNNTKLFFFDADTIEKNGDAVTIWIKYVLEPNTPEPDGSYSKAYRMVYFCKKRTYQSLMSSLYDKSHNFIRSIPNPTKEYGVIADTINEVIMNKVCSVDFPKNQPPVKDNDIYPVADSYFETLKAMTTDKAPK